MSLENPYRAAGAFSGKAYIHRDADAQLLEQIDDNQYYPYFAAPRQSGKSSLLLRTMAALDTTRYRKALVDLSPFVVTSYEDFWRQFLHEVARSANFDPTPIGQEDPRDVFLLWLRGCSQRLIVFMDEIDVLLGVDFREQIFSKFRTFYNLRARPDTAELERLQFVLAGAAHSSRFIKDPRWSPFNVAIEIELEDLSPAQVTQLAAYLGTAGAFAGPDMTARVYELSRGSVFLCQLIFEQLWNLAARGKQRLDPADVDAVVTTIVAESPRNIHFYNIFRLVTADARLTMLFRRLTEGQELGHEEHKELRLTGICRGANPFRNDIYARVFGPGGPLDLKVGDKQIQLTRALDGAIDRRDRLQGDPRADARAIAAAEAEIRRLRKQFREGSQLQVGDVLGRGRFRLEERIGQGGFATVWRALDTRDNRLTAIKVLHGQFAEDKSRRERFFRGAWKMSELQHPSIVRVIEPYGDENGQFYFVMEFLPGGTLHDAVRDEMITPERALKIITGVGRALQFAHERGLIHRDVKPSNVIIDGDNGKLTDFDLVREADITGGTRTGAMGTFLYAAPEVMSRPQDADVRADVYGLGMTTVFALYGGDLAMDVIRDADRFIDRLPCNAVLHDVLKKAVAWDRNDRFPSAADLVAALERASEVDEPVAAGQGSKLALAAPALVVAAAPGAAPVVMASVSAAVAPELDPYRGLSEAVEPLADDGFAEEERETAWEHEVLVPERTGTSMLRATFERVDAASKVRPPRSAPQRSQQAPVSEASKRARTSAAVFRAVPDIVAGSAAASPGPAAPQAVPLVESYKVSRRSGLPLLLLAGGLAAALLLAFVVRGLLTPDDGGAERIAADTVRAAATRGAEASRPDDGGGTGPELGLPIGPLPGPITAPKFGPDIPVRPTLEPDPPPTTAPTLAPDPAATTESVADPSANQAEAGATTSGPESDPTKATSDSPDRSTTAGETHKPSGTGAAPQVPVSQQISEGCLQVRGGNAEIGVAVLLKAHDRLPGDMRLLGCIADGYAKLGRYDSAANFYERMLDRWERHPKALLGAAQANEYMNRRNAARMFYRRLIEVEPDNQSAQAFFAEDERQGPRPIPLK